MTTTDWHADRALLSSFAADPGAMDDATASSVEAHLVACATCRRQLTSFVDQSVVARHWDDIADRIDRPRPSLVERLLVRLGVADGPARVVASTPALRLAGLVAITAIAVAAAVASRAADAAGPFLVLAPLAPLAAVAASFAPVSDPAGEAGVATPLHGIGLLLRRAAVVLPATFLMVGGAAAVVPGVTSVAAAWVLPAVALVAAALALATWTRVDVAAPAVAAVWVVAVPSIRFVQGRRLAFADTVVFSTAGQLSALAAAAVLVAVLAARRDRFATLEATR